MDYKLLNKLNTQINNLEIERQELLNRNKLEEEQSIKDLTWTKNYEAAFTIESIYGVGMPKYSIVVYGQPPSTISSICVMGNHSLYENNMMYGNKYLGDRKSHFYTSNTKILLEFLNKVKFKKLHFNEEQLLVLKEVERISKGEN